MNRGRERFLPSLGVLLPLFWVGFWPLPVFASVSTGTPAWQRANYDGVSVCVPSRPTLRERLTPTVFGDVITEVWLSTNEDGQYTVTFSHLPFLADFFATRTLMFDRAGRKMVEELGAELKVSRVISDGGFQHEIEFDIRDVDTELVAVGRARFAYHPRTIVAVSTIVFPDRQGHATRFFSSVDRPTTAACHGGTL